jgi:hypothetical protein
MIKVTVTLDHIAAAKPMPNSSPIALALHEMGYENATVTHRYAYLNQDVYQLPDIATENEIRFDYLAKQGKIQGETFGELEAYEFELGAKINVA